MHDISDFSDPAALQWLQKLQMLGEHRCVFLTVTFDQVMLGVHDYFLFILFIILFIFWVDRRHFYFKW